ncbi:MAG: heavy metal-responsive transcriptional regulator [Chloroflexi bacterium]|nr:MAG: heavy metal-responsive transcriptional regulator [Chloroflexota bacterium]
MSKLRDRLRIGDVARESGVSVKALRYYETLGLVSPSGRTEAGYRLYSDDSLDRLRFVRQAQALGLPLRDIGEIIRIREGGRTPCEHVRGLVARQITALDAKVEQLDDLRRRLVALQSSLQQSDNGQLAAGIICPCLQAESEHSSVNGQHRAEPGLARH